MSEPERPNLGPAEPRGETVGGGGQVQTTDPAEAESWLSQLEQVQQSKVYESMPKAQQDAIEAQREQREYHDGTQSNWHGQYQYSRIRRNSQFPFADVHPQSGRWLEQQSSDRTPNASVRISLFHRQRHRLF